MRNSPFKIEDQQINEDKSTYNQRYFNQASKDFSIKEQIANNQSDNLSIFLKETSEILNQKNIYNQELNQQNNQKNTATTQQQFINQQIVKNNINIPINLQESDFFNSIEKCLKNLSIEMPSSGNNDQFNLQNNTFEFLQNQNSILANQINQTNDKKQSQFNSILNFQSPMSNQNYYEGRKKIGEDIQILKNSTQANFEYIMKKPLSSQLLFRQKNKPPNLIDNLYNPITNNQNQNTINTKMFDSDFMQLINTQGEINQEDFNQELNNARHDIASPTLRNKLYESVININDTQQKIDQNESYLQQIEQILNGIDDDEIPKDLQFKPILDQMEEEEQNQLQIKNANLNNNIQNKQQSSLSFIQNLSILLKDIPSTNNVNNALLKDDMSLLINLKESYLNDGNTFQIPKDQKQVVKDFLLKEQGKIKEQVKNLEKIIEKESKMISQQKMSNKENLILPNDSFSAVQQDCQNIQQLNSPSNLKLKIQHENEQYNILKEKQNISPQNQIPTISRLKTPQFPNLTSNYQQEGSHCSSNQQQVQVIKHESIITEEEIQQIKKQNKKKKNTVCLIF